MNKKDVQLAFGCLIILGLGAIGVISFGFLIRAFIWACGFSS